MRQLLPEPADPIDPYEAHAAARRPAPAGRPWIALNMVTSTDGAISIEGRSGSLGGEADHEVFRAIRGIGDVIVAAGGTVRAEAYGPPKPSEAVRAARLARGQAERPRMAVVSGSLDLDETSPYFTEAWEPPLVYTAASAPADRVAALRRVAEVVVAGVQSVDLAAMARHLGSLGTACAVVEGGGILNGHLLGADLIDELNLTLAPMVVGGDSHRVVVSTLEHPRHLSLAHLWEADGSLLARYVRPDAP
ncbi:dihydrofolate reductase family protein [Aquihabitans daechungensis]|uniref:dihydrofolate reductase family protein n=1 Tax=Aquihabitans daechungensis TaxID=1052257 RepID=UPI003BA2251B